MFPLRVRSFYSLLQGTASPASLCYRARTLGYSGLAMTDRDNLYGLWEFLKACKKEGLRPVVGAEISEPGTERIITCLVQNSNGYANLCKLLTRRHTVKNFTLEKDIVTQADGLWVLCDDMSLLDKYMRQGVQVAADLGCRPTAIGRTLRGFAGKNNLPAIVTPDSSVLDREDEQLFCLLQAVRNGATIGQVMQKKSAEQVNPLVSGRQYEERFAIWPEVLTATETVAAACEYSGPEFGIVMPPWRGDDGRGSAAVLREKGYSGARRRYGDDLGEQVIERLEHELAVIEKMGFSSYFLVVRDIVLRKGADGKRKKRRICGRGSGAASLVAYCLEITNVCPIKYNLYFERFLNPDRSDPPDIDIDFSWDERDDVLKDVLKDFAGHSALVCNHVFFKPRSAIRETAKAFGLPESEISGLTRRIPWIQKTGGGNLASRLSELPTFNKQQLLSPWPEILGLAEKLIGLPRYLSVHPGGVVITPKPLCQYVPIERSRKGVPIIQWEKDGAEEAGLVKIDLLGNRSLGVIRDCVAAVAGRGVIIDENTWQPEDDASTKMLVARGETMGCFYIESPAMRLLEKKAGSGDFEQLVIQSSIIRPAANAFVREYVRRLHGGAWEPLCPEIGNVLDETFGLMVYQEDVSKVAVALAAFSHGEADGLRKVLSKKDRLLRLHNYKNKFFAGCRRKNIEQIVVEQVWQMMMSFDGYSFCKPHSASYARVSFQAAFLKRHYPAEFMAAVLSNRGGYYSTFAYVSEAKRLGLTILPPDVQVSRLQWAGRIDELRVGFQEIQGLSAECIGRILDNRDKRVFQHLGDFLSRVKPADNEARLLIHAGALDSLDPADNRTALLWQLADFQRTAFNKRKISLFEMKLPAAPSLSPPDVKSKARSEFDVLGFLCALHPLNFFNCRHDAVKVHELQARINQRVQLVVWLLSAKLVSTRTGEAMEFLTFEDETGQVETTFFPKIYKKYAYVLKSGRAYVLNGIVEEDFGALTCTVDTVRRL